MNAKYVLIAAMVAILAVPASAQQRKKNKQAGPQPVPDGPMRVEPVSIIDSRVKNFVEVTDTRETSFQVQARLIGPKVAEIIRLGTPIIEQMVDNNGQALVDPDQFTLVQRERTRPYNIPQGAKDRGFINMRIPTRVAPNRTATSIAKCKGYLWIVYGGEPEPIHIRKPMRFYGKYIEDPRLEKLGITVRMLTEEEAPETALDEKSFALAIETGEDLIRNVTVYDDWLRNTNTRPKQINEETRKFTLYNMISGRFHNDCELTFYVYPNIERVKLDFEWTDLELP